MKNGKFYSTLDFYENGYGIFAITSNNLENVSNVNHTNKMK